MTKKFLRETYVEIELDKISSNLARLRTEVGPDCRIYAVIKGEGYGVGLVEAARTLEQADVDALAVANADDVVRLREAEIRSPVLAYGSTPPDRMSELAQLDAILTIHDIPGMRALVALPGRPTGPVTVFVKVDCGLARLGVADKELDTVFATLSKATHLRVGGIYSHLADQEDEARVREQADRLYRACRVAAEYGIHPEVRMLSSSRVILEHPDLNLSAVDPGKLIFGLAREDWEVGHEYETVITRFAARVIQVSDLEPGTRPYGSQEPLTRPMRVAVVAAGTADGLLFNQPGQPALVRGQRVRQLGASGIEHSILDITGIPEVCVGDEVVYFGRQAGEEISPLEFAKSCNQPIDQALPIIGRLARRKYKEAKRT